MIEGTTLLDLEPVHLRYIYTYTGGNIEGTSLLHPESLHLRYIPIPGKTLRGWPYTSRAVTYWLYTVNHFKIAKPTFACFENISIVFIMVYFFY